MSAPFTTVNMTSKIWGWFKSAPALKLRPILSIFSLTFCTSPNSICKHNQTCLLTKKFSASEIVILLKFQFFESFKIDGMGLKHQQLRNFFDKLKAFRILILSLQ